MSANLKLRLNLPASPDWIQAQARKSGPVKNERTREMITLIMAACAMIAIMMGGGGGESANGLLLELRIRYLEFRI